MKQKINIRDIYEGRDRIIKHKSGWTICLYPMPDYSTTYAIFGTKYGSVDTTFKTKNDDNYVTVPEGIAHYLEHKLFENDECDAFELYSKTGASANAFTSFDCTAYLFTCTQKFAENLRILLNLVQEPYFTDENVEKERGIITQEIKMYLDDPGTRVFYNCLGGIYHNNPAKIDIAGTVESIQKIDKELLYRCYNTFYNLNNMVLSIAGNFDPDEALSICDELLKTNEDPQIYVIVPDEPYEVKEKRVIQKLACAIPMFQIGFKIPYPKDPIKDYLLYNIMLEKERLLEAVKALDAKNKHVDVLRAKVIFFRDFLEYKKDRYVPLMETDFHILSDRYNDQSDMLLESISSIEARGGGDIPEDGLEALACAMQSDWCEPITNHKRRHIIVVFTDAPTHELGFGKSCDLYPKNMPENFEQLTQMWGNKLNRKGMMDYYAKRLILFAPETDRLPIDDGWRRIVRGKKDENGRIIEKPWENLDLIQIKPNDDFCDVDFQRILDRIVNSV